MVVFGLDIGSTGCKCVAFRESGEELCSSYTEYAQTPGNPNLDPVILRDYVFGVIRNCAEKLESSASVAAIAVSSFGESFVALDKASRPLGDIIMYYIDSAGDSFGRVVGSVGAERIMDITGVKPDTMYSLAKMLPALEEHGGKLWKFLEVSDYIVWSLCGETVTDHSLATRTMLFDLKELDWSDELLSASGVRRDMLATPVKSGSIAGKITSEAARELGLHKGVRILICSQDQVTNALGAGVSAPGDAVDGNGTVECITPLFTGIPGVGFTRKNYVTIPYISDGDYVTYAFNFTGGALLKWYQAAYGAGLQGGPGESFYTYMDRMCPPEPSNLLVLPHFQGAGGTPDMVKDARGIIWGLGMADNPYTIYRALMEGLTFEMKYNLESLSGFGIKPARLFASGGGARSAAWLKIKADIWGLDIIPVLADEAGAQGAAIMAVAAVHGEPAGRVAERFVKHGAAVAPNPENAGQYAKKYDEYKALRAYSLSQCKDFR